MTSQITLTAKTFIQKKRICLKRNCSRCFISNFVSLSIFQPYERMNLADALVTKPYSDGQCIISQVWLNGKAIKSSFDHFLLARWADLYIEKKEKTDCFQQSERLSKVTRGQGLKICFHNKSPKTEHIDEYQHSL